MWTSNTGLLPEEQTASQRGFDARPMLMIHFPEQTREVDVGRPFPQLTLHRIIVSMLQGHIESAADLEAWSQTQWTQEPATLPRSALAGAATGK